MSDNANTPRSEFVEFWAPLLANLRVIQQRNPREPHQGVVQSDYHWGPSVPGGAGWSAPGGQEIFTADEARRVAEETDRMRTFLGEVLPPTVPGGSSG